VVFRYIGGGEIHRGPDFQQDVILSNFLHFGSARLAMTDPLPRSNQPFRSENSMLVFNGEIYNHKKLRKELETIGVSFETESDTEVLIKYLDHWGESTCQKIEGMYAFVYFNSKENMLILSRDPLGKKPLYFSISNQTIHWSSSLKSLRELQENQILNKKSMGEYLTLGYTLDPTTIIQDIFAVQPGHILKFTLQGELLKEIKPTQARRRKNLPKIHSSFREVLNSAVA
jgi:asparagine synthase (glutamine-hydrolysing)